VTVQQAIRAELALPPYEPSENDDPAV
jgi:hypothetical protein